MGQVGSSCFRSKRPPNSLDLNHPQRPGKQVQRYLDHRLTSPRFSAIHHDDATGKAKQNQSNLCHAYSRVSFPAGPRQKTPAAARTATSPKDAIRRAWHFL